MTRKVLINGRRIEVSKTEADVAERLARLPQGKAQEEFAIWYSNSTTPESQQRRSNVGVALNLKV